MTSNETINESVDQTTEMKGEATTAPPPQPQNAAPSVGPVAGAGAVVSAGLGVVSLTGTPLADMLRSRQEIIGQIETATGAGGGEIEAFYGAPWNVAAVANGVFGLLAVLLGGVLLVALGARRDDRGWVRALAWGGVILGALGMFIAAGMFFDLFAAQPELPPMPAGPMGG